MFIRTSLRRILLPLILWSCGNALAQNLMKTTVPASFQKDFAVYEVRDQPGVYIYAPLKMQLVTDPQTSKSKIGFQYFSENNKKITKLNVTASLQFIVDQMKLREVIAWAKQKKGPSAKVGPMSSISLECGPYIISTSGKLILTKGAPYNVTLDSTVQIAGTFDFLSTKMLGELMRVRNSIGFLCKVSHQRIFEGPNGLSISVEELNSKLNKFAWIPIEDGFDSIVESILDLRAPQLNQIERRSARIAVIKWILNLQAEPFPKLGYLGGNEWGFDFSSPIVQLRVKQLGQLNLTSSDQSSYAPVRYSIFSIDDACKEFDKQIINLDSGGVGCDEIK